MEKIERKINLSSIISMGIILLFCIWLFASAKADTRFIMRWGKFITVGILFIIMLFIPLGFGLRKWVCTACSSDMEHVDSFFRIQADKLLNDAFNSNQVENLDKLWSLVAKEGPNTVNLSLSYCPKCLSTGVVNLEDDDSFTPSVKNRLICDQWPKAIFESIKKSTTGFSVEMIKMIDYFQECRDAVGARSAKLEKAFAELRINNESIYKLKRTEKNIPRFNYLVEMEAPLSAALATQIDSSHEEYGRIRKQMAEKLLDICNGIAKNPGCESFMLDLVDEFDNVLVAIREKIRNIAPYYYYSDLVSNTSRLNFVDVMETEIDLESSTSEFISGIRSNLKRAKGNYESSGKEQKQDERYSPNLNNDAEFYIHLDRLCIESGVTLTHELVLSKYKIAVRRLHPDGKAPEDFEYFNMQLQKINESKDYLLKFI